jgi:hypothetical protein
MFKENCRILFKKIVDAYVGDNNRLKIVDRFGSTYFR